MKITLINKSDTGGGAAAAGHRLFSALKEAGTDVEMVVQHRHSRDEGITALVNSATDEAIAGLDFLSERLPFILRERDRSVRFAFSTAISGRSIAGHPSIKNADILHFHWTNGGFLSNDNLRELFSLKKPVVWTLHDMWPFTGGCHYSDGCTRFRESCGDCPFLRRPHPQDISRTGWLKKHEIYKYAANITFVACSNWMKDEAMKSSLLKGLRIETIPNPIDITLFSPGDREKNREKWDILPHEKVILFGAANINDKRKGIRYLIPALGKLKAMFPGDTPVRIILFGKNRRLDTSILPFPVTALPVVDSALELAGLYSAADVFVLPSVEDNLPNMAMEALSCGTPVVAFDTGGLRDLVDHKVNGYLASYLSEDDLANGLKWALAEDTSSIREIARHKVIENFTYPVVAKAYREIYREIRYGKG